MEYYSTIKNEIISKVCRKMDGTGDHHVEQDKPSSKWQISHFCSYVRFRPKIVMM
jgi:hypothetical protein